MSGVYQHHTCRLGVLGVQPEHVYGEGDFVGDALAWRLGLVPKFQVFVAIVRPLAVFVMNCFGRQKRAAQLLFHNKSMLKHFRALTAAVQKSRNCYPNVPLLFTAAKFSALGGAGRCALMAKLGTARCAAKFFLLIDRPARTPLDWHRLSALNAVYLPLLVRKLSALAAAFGRAVQRVSAVPFSVAAQFSGAAHERLAAYFASEGNSLNALNPAIKGVVALRIAEFSQLAAIVWGSYLFSAVEALFHKAYSVVSDYKYQTQNGLSTARGVS